METSSLQTVFHGTGPKSLADILKSNSLRLSHSATDGVDSGHKLAPFYLSTARNISSRYIRGSSSVVLELDADKLSNRLKSRALDYWRDTTNDAIPESSEQEERFYSKSRILDNVSQYIRAIHVLVPEEKEYARGSWRFLRISALAAKRLGIPTKYYRSFKELALRRNSVPAHEVYKSMLKFTGTPSSRPEHLYSVDWALLVAVPKMWTLLNGSNPMPRIEAYKASLNSEQRKGVDKVLMWARSYPHDFVTQLGTALHNNNKGSNYAGQLATKFSRVLHRLGYRETAPFAKEFLNKYHEALRSTETSSASSFATLVKRVKELPKAVADTTMGGNCGQFAYALALYAMASNLYRKDELGLGFIVDATEDYDSLLNGELDVYHVVLDTPHGYIDGNGAVKSNGLKWIFNEYPKAQDIHCVTIDMSDGQKAYVTANNDTNWKVQYTAFLEALNG